MSVALRDVKIYHALMDRLKAQMPGVSIVEPNETFTPNADEWFLSVDDFRQEGIRKYVENGGTEEFLGMMTVTAAIPLDMGHKDGLIIASQVADVFPDGLAMLYDDVLVRIRKKTQYEGVSYHDGAFIRYPITVRWRYLG